MPSWRSPFPMHRFEALLLTRDLAGPVIDRAPAAVRGRLQRTTQRLVDLSRAAWRTAAAPDRPDGRRAQDRVPALLRRMNVGAPTKRQALSPRSEARALHMTTGRLDATRRFIRI